MLTSLVPDPGFLRGGGTNSKGACEKLLFVQFSLHENKRNWRAHPCVPLGSVNALVSMKKIAVAITPCEQSFNAVFYSWNIFKIKRVLRTQHAKV